ncbi:phage major tail protein, TP901-1 family [Litorimonas sp. RW-G-Af-16]|uniref:phage major tail protein, TP901-1 family n=1 Tax=Litorimonas sp. RW-G-Af-16 TaxID=3241168 RepID=UPI00390CBAE8
MAAQRGSDMLLKIKNDAGDYVTVAGLRTKNFRLNSRPVDITDTGSVDGWKELLPGAGTKSVEISGAGVFRDGASDALMRQAFFEQSVIECQCIIPDFGTLTGPFILSALSYSGTYQGEASFDVSLVSAGVPQFAAF